MSPIALFDKSFLESLNLDEAVLFDHFFYPVTCPIFYVETLADLEKQVRSGRTPEQVVGAIANKMPEMHGAPCIHHRKLAIANLHGGPVAMTGQIPIAGGRPVRVDGKNGVVIDTGPETRAYQRWQRGDFLDLERDFARGWRQDLGTLDLEQVAAASHRFGVDLSGCRDMANVLERVDRVLQVLSVDNQMELMLEHVQPPQAVRATIASRWREEGSPQPSQYAPYAYYLLRVNLFFELALGAGRISTQRPSNRNDIAYLYYLPFCMAFFSSDRLHREAAPLFMRPDQSFVWGQDAKVALKENNEAMLQLPEEVRKRGLISIGTDPRPGLILDLYDRYMQRRTTTARADAARLKAPEMFEKIRQAPTLPLDEVDFAPQDADSVTVERLVSRSRGSWFQVPEDLKR